MYLPNYLHTYQYYIHLYVVVVAFEALADVINIVNYSFNAHWLKNEGAVNDFFFFGFCFFAGGEGGWRITSLLFLSLSLGPNSTCLQVYS